MNMKQSRPITPRNPIYIRFSEDKIVKTEDHQGLITDYDEAGRIVGVEVLHGWLVETLNPFPGTYTRTVTKSF